MHCARAFDLALEAEGCDIFQRFSDAEFAKVRPRAHRCSAAGSLAQPRCWHLVWLADW